jgi:hypothetical protein
LLVKWTLTLLPIDFSLRYCWLVYFIHSFYWVFRLFSIFHCLLLLFLLLFDYYLIIIYLPWVIKFGSDILKGYSIGSDFVQSSSY